MDVDALVIPGSQPMYGESMPELVGTWPRPALGGLETFPAK